MTAVSQPAGSVFTDIEGSTNLLSELGTEPYRKALAEHRRIVREVAITESRALARTATCGAGRPAV